MGDLLKTKDMKTIELTLNTFGEMAVKSFKVHTYDRYCGAGVVTDFARKLINTQYKGTDMGVIFKLTVPDNVVTLHCSARKTVTVNYFLYRIYAARFNGYSLDVDKIIPIWETEEFYFKHRANS